jgi:hypothetical protein
MTIAGTGHVLWKDRDRTEQNKSMTRHENDPMDRTDTPDKIKYAITWLN